jgi:hypothetical protein
LCAHHESTPRQTPARARLTDSPWFWLLVFANAALLGVAVIGPKYNVRQGAVERRYEARREIARRAFEQPTGETSPDGTGPSDATADASGPDQTDLLDNSAHIVPLLPLALVLVVGNLLAIVLFAYSQVRQMRSAAQNSHGPSP